MDFSRAVLKVKNANKILLVSHYDCDGLCSAKILSDALKKENKDIKIKIVKEISSEIIEEIEKEFDDGNFELIIFSDLGSGYLSLLPKDKEIVILDHHVPEKVKIPENIIQVNPCLEGKELCGAGVCYLFVSELGKYDELIDYAVVGSIGDHQIDIDENKKVKVLAEKIGRLKTEPGLNIFGHVNRPIHETLSRANFFPLNGHSEVVQFLSELDIELHHNGKIKSYYDLSEEEKKKLSLEIIKERISNNIEEPANIFSSIYILTNQPREFMDALEFSTIFNSFGRLEKYEEVFEMLDGNMEILTEVRREYGRKLSGYLAWAERNMKKFPKTENILFLNAKDKVDENMIGTIASILINGTIDKKIVVGLAHAEDGIKLSTRSKMPGIDLDEIVSRICGKLGGGGGGHKEAAGGKIEKGKEEEFIELFGKEIDG